MKKKFHKIIELPCEESEKKNISSRIRDYLAENEDYKNGNILVNDDRFETIDIVIFEGCSNIEELVKVISW